MRPLALALAATLSACSGLPPDTLVPLGGGEVVSGVNVAVDLGALRRPDLAAWIGVGLGRGVDVAFGFDLPLLLISAGPANSAALLFGRPPGMAVRKTWPSGVGVGLGASTRLDATAVDSSGRSLASLSTVGPFVTVGPRSGAGGVARVTAQVVYARTQRDAGQGVPVAHALAVQVGAQAGPRVALDDTSAVFVAGRAQAGLVLFPTRGLTLLHGPTVGLTVQSVSRP
ncbi:MAG TPA: hypothetical protein VF576_13715 [Rubricoccaceae bacterium]|jgi:hypothetical protein